MKKIVFCVLFFCAWSFSFTQSSLPKNISDSLWSVWMNESKPDTTRLKAFNRYIEEGYLRSQPDSAFYFADLQFQFAKERGLKREMGHALQTKGSALYNQGDFARSIDFYHQSLIIHQEIGYKIGIAAIYGNLGNAYFNYGDYLKTKEYYLLSYKMQEELGDKKGMAFGLNNLGNVHGVQGNYIVALDYFARSLEIKIALNDKPGMANGYNNIGIIYADQGDFIKALEYYNIALALRKEIGINRTIAASLNNIGTAYVSISRWTTAIEYFSQSLELYKANNDKQGIATAFNNIGAAYMSAKKFTEALDYTFQSLKITEALVDKRLHLSNLGNIGAIYDRMEVYDSAIFYAQRCYEMALDLGLMNNLKLAAQALLNGYIQTGKLDMALINLSIIRKLVEQDLSMNYFALAEHEKELYFSTVESDLSRYYDFTVHFADSFPNLSDTAYNLALQNKNLTLKSTTALRQTILDSHDSLLIADYEEWIKIKKNIAEMYARGGDTHELEKTATAIEQDLVKRSNVFNDFEKIRTLDWKQVRDKLGNNECAVEFVHFNSAIDTTKSDIYAALVVRSTSVHPEVVRLCYESDLAEIFGKFQGNNSEFVKAVYGTRQRAQGALYEKIWKPLEPHLNNIKTVYYSPSGLLHKVSFATICKGQDVYLSDVYDFRQMGSTGNLAFENKTEFGELENFLLMGGVQYNSDSTEKKVWDYLPGSLSETNTINSYLQKKKFGVNYFKDGNASEEIFKEKITSSSIVHIATHGFFFPDPEQVRAEMKADSESNQELKFRGTTNYANWSFVNNKNPLMRSGIVLAGANDVWQRGALAEGEDGILTAQEVSNLDLRNTKLVVLSACETGLGDIKGSEGVFGLQRAFKMAGVKYLIMSLWQVPDKETSEFMILFYKNLLKIKDIPTAFQKTQTVMRQKYDPYYWGAFVLIE